MTTLRLSTTLALLCFATPLAWGQLPVAPEPHPTLDELVKEYRRWGLPIPSATPTLEELEGLDGWPDDPFALAVQSKLRGRDEHARALYAEARKKLAGGRRVGWKPGSAVGCFHFTAWLYWQRQLTEKTSDRKVAFGHLRILATEDPSLLKHSAGVFDDKATMLRDLELTIASRKSKPGSVEALIDGMTDHWDNPDDLYDRTGQDAYWKLIDLGFDAVPKLMEHVEDKRLTRTQIWDGLFSRGIYRVGSVAEWILNGLSGGEYDIEAHWVQQKDLVPMKDHKWWKKAQKVGEERWLLDIVLPPPHEGYEPVTPNEIALRVIRVKYPNRLGDVYRTLMTERPKIGSELVTKEIVASKLPRERKLALLEEGATNKDFSHRHYALETIAPLDGALFRKHLLQSIKSIPATITFEQDAYNPELWVVGLIRKTDDRECWYALTELTRRASPSTRHHLINSTSWPTEPNEPDPGRFECIRYLRAFLDDSEVGDVPWHGPQAVRDHTTKRLAHLLGLAELEYVKTLRSPREISLLREVVREAAERELSRPRK